MKETEHKVTYWKKLATITLAALVMAAVLIPTYTAFSQEDPSATVRDKVADRLSERLTTILDRIDEEMAQLSGDKFPALQDQLEAISSLLDDLALAIQNPPKQDTGGPAAKEEIVKLDLMLHRLVTVLERIASTDETQSTPAQGRLHGAISDLRLWINGYIAGATSDMGPLEARRYERMARTLLTDVGKHVAKMAEQARPKEEEPSRLDVIIEHIKAQLHLLDHFILRNFRVARRLPRIP